MPAFREWFLHTLNDADGKLFYIIAGPKPRMINKDQYEEPVHVIEYAAIAEMQAEIDSLVKRIADLSFHNAEKIKEIERLCGALKEKKYFHWLFCSYSKWSEPFFVRTTSWSNGGYRGYEAQYRVCEICGKREERIV